jgi:ATP synthase subunit 6
LYNKLIYKKFILLVYFVVNLTKNLIRELLGLEKNIHFPLFLFLFLLLLLCNLSGMLPYSLSITSHFSITFTLAFIFFFAFNIIAIFLYKDNFVCLFLPHGTPILILPFIILIELISYLTRVLSLSIRLFANIISGHTLLKILGTFVFSIITILSI